MNLRTIDPPNFEVGEPLIKGGATGKHHVYKIKGVDHLG
jgi:hypothetical protein